MIRKMLLLLTIALLGCESLFEDVEDTPVENYNLFFEYLTRDYAYRDEHAFTMDELKARYWPELAANPTEQKLAEVLVKIENDLLDPHVYFTYPGGSSWVYNLTGQFRPNYSLEKDAVEQDAKFPLWYEVDIINSNNYFTYGTVFNHSSIGYVFINALSDQFGGRGRLEGNQWREEINAILKTFADRSIDKLIVDIRSNAGGSNYNATYIANRFVNTSAPYLIEEYEVGDETYDQLTFRVNPEGDHAFRTGKIALLSNNNTCSGGEFFLLAILTRDNLVHIGTPSAGCAGSIVERDLYNGWNVVLTSTKTTRANGETYYKTGIKPQIIVRNNEDYGITSRSDQLIERAITELE